ncbi:hypothetical protein AALO_G00054440 [Alosa alosa]|uniref:Fork-head domain-containing protein n=1 Tax=Alosa alosa TaxID=278164 RepID=A0AAV6H8G7_9TELE|nr:forkhead box protein P3a [Alosa alosa]KAG5282297.1 hypothetical protein AALO_G00054440 [Alosa alosa]
MPRNDNAEGSKGHEGDSQKTQLEKFSGGARSRGSMFTPAHAQSAHVSQSVSIKVHKQPLQLRPLRPTVLRKGHQLLSQDLSLSTERPDVNCQARSNQSSPHWPDSSCQNKGPPSDIKAAGSTQGSPERSLTSSGSEAASENSPFVKGTCRWPGCNQKLEEPSYFSRHLCPEHGTGDTSLAEWRDQRERVQYMDKQLALERKKLQEMQFHLHLSDHGDTAENEGVERNLGDPLRVPHFMLPNGGIQGAMVTPNDLLSTSYLHFPASQFMPGVMSTIDCYKNNNIRPPYTYAAMIRCAILDSPEKQLALNEIYQWFTNMFHYFRYNTATWKNAVRHNLSLHKCFVRVEGVKGSVWTVDDAEFMRRKGQKIHRNQDFNLVTPYFFYAQ